MAIKGPNLSARRSLGRRRGDLPEPTVVVRGAKSTGEEPSGDDAAMTAAEALFTLTDRGKQR